MADIHQQEGTIAYRNLGFANFYHSFVDSAQLFNHLPHSPRPRYHSGGHPKPSRPSLRSRSAFPRLSSSSCRTRRSSLFSRLTPRILELEQYSRNEPRMVKYPPVLTIRRLSSAERNYAIGDRWISLHFSFATFLLLSHLHNH